MILECEKLKPTINDVNKEILEVGIFQWIELLVQLILRNINQSKNTCKLIQAIFEESQDYESFKKMIKTEVCAITHFVLCLLYNILFNVSFQQLT